MANVVITSDNSSVFIDNGVYAGTEGALGVIQKKATFDKSDIRRIALAPSDANVTVWLVEHGVAFILSFDGATGTMQVDSVDGETPSSNSDLYDKLIALKRNCLNPLASSNVTCNNTTTSLVSANATRKGLIITNTGSNAVYLGLDESAVVSKGIYLAAGGTWVMDAFTFTKGSINGITTASTSNISIQEFE